MAAVALPVSVTAQNMSGKWTLDKSLCETNEYTMEVQGLSWLVKKAIAISKIILTVQQKGQEVTVISTGSGTPMSTKEFRRLDWTEVENRIAIFGTLKGRSRILQFKDGEMVAGYDFNGESTLESEEDLAWLTEGWEVEDGLISVLETQGFCIEQGWRSHQVWGFQIVNGKRKHVRKMLLWNKGKMARNTQVYDYLGE